VSTRNCEPSNEQNKWTKNLLSTIYGSACQTLHCPECGERHYDNGCSTPGFVIDPARYHLNGDVTYANTLSGVLQNAFGETSADGYLCHGCKKRKTIKKQMKMCSVPEVLVLTMKRYKQGGDKIKSDIRVERNLDLTDYVLDDDMLGEFVTKVGGTVAALEADVAELEAKRQELRNLEAQLPRNEIAIEEARTKVKEKELKPDAQEQFETQRVDQNRLHQLVMKRKQVRETAVSPAERTAQNKVILAGVIMHQVRTFFSFLFFLIFMPLFSSLFFLFFRFF
jgi:hypothetical protein